MDPSKFNLAHYIALSLATATANLDFARKLIEHCCWEDERVWKLAIAPLSDAQFAQEVSFGLGSIQRECAHIMETERLCLRRIGGGSSPESLISASPLDRRAMRTQWRAIHADWTRYMGALSADRFFSDCAFDDGDGEARLKVWQLIFDVIYQGTTHRADIMRIVAEVHEAPQFDLSLMQFLSGVFRQ